MTANEFLNQLRHDEIVAAIGAAEMGTSGEIRVFVSRKEIEDALIAAQCEFERLGMRKTKHRNGVLIYVAPRTRKFAVVGDAGIHAHCGNDFWRQVADEMSALFREGEFTAGIVHGVRRAGELLGKHFSHERDDRNELSDEVAHD
ncbi:MAG: hypothetical protein A2107_04410 [Verrucomicrobia bacterium GWF2_62_7]|nr:MAG: hypothetical protein A2107_04410 [Verrucomicrobia bacterium GWF2_62_7]